MRQAPTIRKDLSHQATGAAGYALGPLRPGIAAALGGALRRAILGCLPAPAITGATIQGATHPFATLSGVSPDVSLLLRRLARVRLSGDSPMPAQAHLRATGPGSVGAADLRLPAGLSVLNPELELAALDPGSTLDLTATVDIGTGFSPRAVSGRSGAFAVAGCHRPVQRVRVETAGDELRLELCRPCADPDAILSDAAMLLEAHVQALLPGDRARVFASDLSTALRRQWGPELSAITYSYAATSATVTLNGIRPEIAGPVGELVAAGLLALAEGPAIVAESTVLSPPTGQSALRIACEAPDEVDCLGTLRQTAEALCDLLGALCEQAVSEPVSLPPAPPVERRSPVGRLELTPPDLGFIAEGLPCEPTLPAGQPAALLDIPRHSYARLVDHSAGSLSALISEFFPLAPPDCAWRVELREVRFPQPPRSPAECRASGEGFQTPILVRVALLGPGSMLVQEREVSLGMLPLMTPDATFILPGKQTETVVASELAPGPGLLAFRLGDRGYAALAPDRGPSLLLRTRPGGRCPVVGQASGPTVDVGTVLIALGASPDAEVPVPAGLPAALCADRLAGWLGGARHTDTGAAQAALASCLGLPGPDASADTPDRAFSDPRAWALSPWARERLQRRLGVRTGDGPLLTWEDVAAAALLCEAVGEGAVPSDEPVSLATHTLRTAGAQVLQVVRQALVAQIPAVLARLQAAGAQAPDVADLLGDVTLGAAIASFFSSSPLVSPVDGPNPLARLESARRVCVSIGRDLGYDADAPDCRQLPADAPGRLCMIQTPEGPNVGLVTYLASGARVDEHGLLLAPLRPIRDGAVADEVVWLSADDELAANVADPLPPGTVVTELGASVVCRCHGLLTRCAPSELQYCEAGHGSNVSISAALIPAAAHSNATRLLMGANMQRQAVEVLEPEWPLVATGIEDAWDRPPVPGRNCLVAYLPWAGHNFEDAIVVSEELVASGVLSSEHRETLSITLRPEDHLTPRPSGLWTDRLAALGPNGIARVGAVVAPGDVLVGVEAPGALEDEAGDLLDQVAGDVSCRRCLVVPQYVSGTVISVRERPARRGGGRCIEVELSSERPLSRGDKLSNRHGAKGVIGSIVPVEQMPLLPDGNPVEFVLNPLGVPSRLNLGQLFETSLGWLGNAMGARIITPPGVPVDRDRLSELLRRAGLPEDGKVPLRDGRNGRLFDQPALVGFMFLHKLDHMAEDKIHARSTGPYAAITQQPVGGRARSGGQRFGEMETWALEAYGAAHTLREMLTIKSDDVRGREAAFSALLRGEDPSPSDVPESLWLLVEELRALGLRVEM